MAGESIGLWGVPLAVLGGAVRVSTPFLFVSLGECITERSGRINLGLEGTLVMGAMSGYGVSYLTGSPWLGVLAAGAAAVDRLRLVERYSAGPRRIAGQCVVSDRRGAGADPGLGAQDHALGLDHPHGGRERRRRPRHGLFGQPHSPARDHVRRLPRRHRRFVPLVVLSGQLERG